MPTDQFDAGNFPIKVASSQVCQVGNYIPVPRPFPQHLKKQTNKNPKDLRSILRTTYNFWVWSFTLARLLMRRWIWGEEIAAAWPVSLVYFVGFRPMGATVSQVKMTILEEQHGLLVSTCMYTHELADVAQALMHTPKSIIASPPPRRAKQKNLKVKCGLRW